ncbi:MAG: EF-hand domain-containing protein [Winogradskyella arenosi]
MKSFLVLLAFAGSLSVFSQGGRGGRQGGGPPNGEQPEASEILKLLDTNNDGKIEAREAANDRRGKIAEDFEEIDIDGDGFVSLEELEASLNGTVLKSVTVEKLLEAIDHDGDGMLNELEVSAKDQRDLMADFKTIDRNGDAQLDEEELKAYYQKEDSQKRNH